jgi:pimeloyl-ACP methyl ester carboxylesterase
VVDFKGNVATLSLIDPTRKSKASIGRTVRPIEADFSAPLAYYPQKSETWEGLMGAMRVSHYMGTTGLYMLQPYDPERIPLIFVHGLISTPRMWRNVINELERDPVIRAKYQCWVFSYPTGNPPAYTALRLREELAKVRQVYPKAKDYVLVGHSMGGLISRMQTTSVDREAWDLLGQTRAKRIFDRTQPSDLVYRSILFDANPHVSRVIFICTPHRGSEMAKGPIGSLGVRLISLPVDMTGAVVTSMGNTIAELTGKAGRIPNSITGLAPENPMLKVIDSRPIQVPHHSIIGDSAKGDTPDSSDGVVKYWSSHLKSAHSEKIVPYAHGACERPETLRELQRLLLLHLSQTQP